MIPAHSYAKVPKSAKLSEKVYSVDCFGGNDYLTKTKIWTVGSSCFLTFDVLGQARFGTNAEKGEKPAGKAIELEMKFARDLVNSIAKSLKCPVGDSPTGTLFYRPLPKSAANNAVKEQILEATLYTGFLKDIGRDALCRKSCFKSGEPVQQSNLNFAEYKLTPETIIMN